MTVAVRPADPDDHVDIMRLFDGALLETDPNRIRSQLTGERGCLLVAERGGRPVAAVGLWTGPVDDRPTEWAEAVQITAIAVTTARRGQGVGRALIDAAADWAAPRSLSATFDERVLDFYTACGFTIDERAGRLWGVRTPETAD